MNGFETWDNDGRPIAVARGAAFRSTIDTKGAPFGPSFAPLAHGNFTEIEDTHLRCYPRETVTFRRHVDCA